MATVSNTRVNELAEQSQGFPPVVAEQPPMSFLSLAPTSSAPYAPKVERPVPERRPSGFLVLAPTISDSYPRSRHQSISHLTKPLPLTHGPLPEEAVVSPTAPLASLSNSIISQPKSRRSSSVSSDASSTTRKLRFLKLGPVHWGEHQGDHKEDWHEVDEEAISL